MQWQLYTLAMKNTLTQWPHGTTIELSAFWAAHKLLYIYYLQHTGVYKCTCTCTRGSHHCHVGWDQVHNLWLPKIPVTLWPHQNLSWPCDRLMIYCMVTTHVQMIRSVFRGFTHADGQKRAIINSWVTLDMCPSINTLYIHYACLLCMRKR